MSSYEDILSLSWDELPEVKLLPTGPWRLKCRGASLKPPKGDGNPSIMFIYEPIEPLADVSDAELEALGEYDVTENRLFHRFWIENKATDLRTVLRHISKHGVEIEGMSVAEALKAVRGKTVVGVLSQRSFQRQDGSVGEENNIQSFHEDE